MEMLLTKDQVRKLNEMADTNWESAQVALDIVNGILGTDYGWLGKEVVWFETHDKANVAERYAHAHDAYSWAK